MMSSYDERKKIFDTLSQLVKPEYEEIFRILRKYKEIYTENSNGVFFDLSSISEVTFNHIKSYLNFCIKTRQEHERRLKELNDIRMEQHIVLEPDTYKQQS